MSVIGLTADIDTGPALEGLEELDSTVAGLGEQIRRSMPPRDASGRFVRLGEEGRRATEQIGDGARQAGEQIRRAGQEGTTAARRVSAVAQSITDAAGVARRLLSRELHGVADAARALQAELGDLEELEEAQEGVQALATTFGRMGTAAEDAFGAIANPARRLRAQMLAARDAAQSINSPMTALNDHILIMQGRIQNALAKWQPLLSVLGAVGKAALVAAAAFLVVAGAVAGVVAKAFDLLIDRNEKIEKGWEAAVEGGKRLVATFAAAVVGGDKASKALEDLTRVFEAWSKSVEANSRGIHHAFGVMTLGIIDFVSAFVSAYYDVVYYLRGLEAEFASFAESLSLTAGNMSDRVVIAFESIFKEIMLSLKDFGIPADQIFGDVGFINARINDAEARIRDNHLSMVALQKDSVKIWESTEKQVMAEKEAALKKLGSAYNYAAKYFEQPLDINVKDATQKAAREQDFGNSVEAQNNALINQATQAALIRVKTTQEARQALLAEAQYTGEVLRNVLEQLEGFDPIGAMWREFGLDTLRMIGSGMEQLAASSAKMIGGMLASTNTLKQFGDMVLDQLGSMASEIGSFYVKWGFVRGLAGDPTGWAIMAGGLALQVLGGYLGGKGSGNASSSSSRASSSSGGSSRQLATSASNSPSLPPIIARFTSKEGEFEGMVERTTQRAAERGRLRIGRPIRLMG